MQPLQYDSRDRAAKDNSITNAATARSNLDAAITMRSAETELQNTIELRATTSEIVPPKPDISTPERKKDEFEAVFNLNIPGPANGQKKKVVLVNDHVFSQLTYFGSDQAVQPKRPKMAEIWLKSNFLCVSMVSHPITSLSFTIATLVALIDPWRVWLDPWGLRFQA